MNYYMLRDFTDISKARYNCLYVTFSLPLMHPFASYVLRSYYKATGWNEDNLYANLTRSSNGVALLYTF